MTVIAKGQKTEEHADLPILTERLVQHLIFKTYMQKSSHMMAIPNSMVFGWEADMLTVTKSRLIHEYEIKVSRADFLSEKRKIESETATRGAMVKSLRHQALSGTGHRFHIKNRPNVFWYVVAEGVCTPDEIPDYAGLVEVRPGRIMRINQPDSSAYFLHQVKKGPRLHREKISEDRILQLAGHCCYRFWNHIFPNQGEES